ncbi:MAG TPA: ABC transporter ATP-binding protein [Methylomirabilota bacterium]|nr:ABC transporter ATP-binding protein [Methylomirabilota bacterium]
MVLLETVDLTKRFFGLTALDKVSFRVGRGEIVGLIGPNGSGKTTLFNCATGILPVSGGRIRLKGEDITNHATHAIALKGVSRTFQIIRIFPQMTVMDNMLLAIQQHQGERIVSSILRTPGVRRLEREARERASELLDFVGLAARRDDLAAHLSYGQQKLLEFIMAFMPKPEIVLLDEPAAAVNPTMIEKMMDHIVQLNREGYTFCIIEHNMDVVMELCHRVVVLDHGETIAEGTPEAIRNNPDVIEAYLGA